MTAFRIELDAANVGLALNRANRRLLICGPDLDLGVITATGKARRICARKVNTPRPLFVFIIVHGELSCVSIPKCDDTLIVRTGDLRFDIRVPGEAAKSRQYVVDEPDVVS